MGATRRDFQTQRPPASPAPNQEDLTYDSPETEPEEDPRPQNRGKRLTKPVRDAPPAKRVRKDKTKKDKKRKSRTTTHKDPPPNAALADKLEDEVEIIRIQKKMTPSCAEESMLPEDKQQRLEAFEAACQYGMYNLS